MTKIVALVPMRHHSQRVPGKNYRLLGGKPLFHHIISTLLRVPEITEIVVNTDSPNVIEGLQSHFPSVNVIDRPERLRLLKAETISTAIQSFVSKYPAYDSLFSVTRLQTRLWDQLGRAINHNPAILLQTQDLPPVYEENSCIYIFERKTLTSHRNRLGERPLLFEIDSAEAWDIDEELDFQIVEILTKLQPN